MTNTRNTSKLRKKCQLGFIIERMIGGINGACSWRRARASLLVERIWTLQELQHHLLLPAG